MRQNFSWMEQVELVKALLPWRELTVAKEVGASALANEE
jgi:hypothetical protein